MALALALTLTLTLTQDVPRCVLKMTEITSTHIGMANDMKRRSIS